jgi:hypothetical protein
MGRQKRRPAAGGAGALTPSLPCTPPLRSALVSRCTYLEQPTSCAQLAAQGQLPSGTQGYSSPQLTGAAGRPSALHCAWRAWLAAAGSARALRSPGLSMPQRPADGTHPPNLPPAAPCPAPLASHRFLQHPHRLHLWHPGGVL